MLILIVKKQCTAQLCITGLLAFFCPGGQTGPVSGSRFRVDRSFHYAQTFGLNIPALASAPILPALVTLPTEVMLATKVPVQSPCSGCIGL
jgi:hypothetical protein